jgi:hypothetical protein
MTYSQGRLPVRGPQHGVQEDEVCCPDNQAG